MVTLRPMVLTIGSHDPTGNSGITADIKTIESIGVQGMSICTALNFQNENETEGVSWVSKEDIMQQIKPILSHYKMAVIKIGMIKSLKVLKWLTQIVKAYNPDVKLVWDPIIITSNGYRIHRKLSFTGLKEVLTHIDLITPNWNEITELTGIGDALESAVMLSHYTSVYLKGGHHPQKMAVDYLINQGEVREYTPDHVSENFKEGIGCVFSSALACYLAKSSSIEDACRMAKDYVLKYLDRTESTLGIYY